MRTTVGWFALAALLLGAWQCVVHGSSFERVGAFEYLPRVEALSIVGEFGPGFAMMLALVSGVERIDSHARATPPVASHMFRADALLAGGLAPIAFVPFCALLFLGSFAAWRVWWDRPTAAYLTAARETLRASDITASLLVAVLSGALVSALLLVGRRLWTSTTQSRGRKLAAAVAAVVSLNLLARFV